MFFAPILRPIALLTFTIHNHARVAQRIGGSRLFAANFLLDPRLWTLDRLALATKRLKIHKKSTGPPPFTRHALLPQKNFPINIERLLDDDFLVEFFFGAFAASSAHS